MTAADHFAAGVNAITEAADALPAIRAQLDELTRLHAATIEAAAAIATIEDGLHPDRAYTYDQAGRFLGVKAETVRKVPRVLLPRVRGGRVLGVDLMAYRGDVSTETATAYRAAKAAAVERVVGPA